MVELKPCPFCGSNDVHGFDNLVICGECSASGPDLGDTRDRAGAIEAWNRRAPITEGEVSLSEANVKAAAYQLCVDYWKGFGKIMTSPSLSEVSCAARAILAERNRAIAACERGKASFASDEYATSQPMGGLMERFACDRCIEAIRNPDSKENAAIDIATAIRAREPKDA